MKITEMDILTSNATISLDFKISALRNPYIVRDILGLDAEDISSTFYGRSGQTNDRYYNLTLKKRDIVVVLELNPNFALGKAYSDLRDDIFKLISSSRTGLVKLSFKYEGIAVAEISGFVTKVESAQFSNTPQIQIALNCPDPMLRAPTEVNVDVSDTVSHNPHFNVVDDMSNAPHGVRIGFVLGEPNPYFYLQDALDASWRFEANIPGGLLAGDEIHLSSEHNNRYLYMIRDLVMIQLVDKIAPNSLWPVIFPGENDIMHSGTLDWDYISYYPAYWGV